jgi:hypothetical protein
MLQLQFDVARHAFAAETRSSLLLQFVGSASHVAWHCVLSWLIVAASASPAQEAIMSQPWLHSDLKSLPLPPLLPQPCMVPVTNASDPTTPANKAIHFFDMTRTPSSIS